MSAAAVSCTNKTTDVNMVTDAIQEETTATGQTKCISAIVSHYERFPYLRNSRDKATQAADLNKKKFTPNPNLNSNFKRTQSNSCIQARQSQNLVNLPVTNTPKSIFSASMDRLNAVNVIYLLWKMLTIFKNKHRKHFNKFVLKT